MKRLQYIDENDNNILFCRENLKCEEVTARLMTDYIVSKGVIYENMGSWINGIANIKLKKVEEEEVYLDTSRSFNYQTVEFRIYTEDPSKREILKVIDKESMLALLPHLLEFTPVIHGKSLKRCATEIDEDRKVFVVYYLEDCECEV